MLRALDDQLITWNKRLIRPELLSGRQPVCLGCTTVLKPSRPPIHEMPLVLLFVPKGRSILIMLVYIWKAGFNVWRRVFTWMMFQRWTWRPVICYWKQPGKCCVRLPNWKHPLHLSARRWRALALVRAQPGSCLFAHVNLMNENAGI